VPSSTLESKIKALKIDKRHFKSAWRYVSYGGSRIRRHWDLLHARADPRAWRASL